MSWAGAATEAPTRVTTAPPGAHTAAAGRLAAGTRLGSRYEILSLLGEGGMGAVYKARDLELDRLVALKVIKPEVASHHGIVERFKREILLASKVTHRNVLRIHDLGEAGDLRFISMQYIEGRSLAHILRDQGPMPFEQGLALARQLAEALLAAHDAGVVHRDLKPQNILLDESGTPYIADFGISRSIDVDGSVTETGAIVGTVDYMSPEQARGEVVDHRSDIYSLGVIFYEMFTGSLPFKGGSALSVMMKRMTETAPTIRAARPQIPLWLSMLVSRAMQRDAADRYQSVKDLLRDLDRQRAALLWKRTLRRRIPLAAAALAAVAAIGWAGIQLWRTRPAPGPPPPVAERTSLALLPFVNATQDQAFDWVRTGLPDTLAHQLQQARALRLVGAGRVQDLMESLKLDDASFSRAGETTRLAGLLGVENFLRGRLIRTGNTFVLQATLAAAGGGAERSIQVQGSGPDAVLSLADQLTSEVRNALGLRQERGEGRRAAAEITTASVEALRHYTEGLSLARRGSDLEAVDRLERAVEADPGFPLAHAALAEAWHRLGQGEKARAAAARAVDAVGRASDAEAARIRAVRARVAGDLAEAEKAYGQMVDHLPNSAEALLELAQAREDLGDLEGAEGTLRRVAQLDDANPRALYALGRVLDRRGKPAEAEKLFAQLLDLHRRGGNEEGQATALNGLGNVQGSLGHGDEALRSFTSALEIRRRLGDTRGASAALRNIGLVLSSQGSDDEALSRTREAIDLSRQSSDIAGAATGYLNLGDILQGAGRSIEAKDAYEQSLLLVRDLKDEALLARSLSAMGYIDTVLGDYAEAGLMNKQALEKRRALGDRRELLSALIDIGATEQIQGRYDQAIAYGLEAQQLARDIGEVPGQMVLAWNLATIHEDQGAYGAALSLLQDAEPKAREVADSSLLATLLIYLASVRSHAGDAEGARKALAEGLPMADRAGLLPMMAEGLMVEGDLHRAAGGAAAAMASCRRALEMARRAQDVWLTLRARLRVAEAAGGLAEVTAVAEEAERRGLAPLVSRARMAAARLLEGDGRHADALAAADRVVASATPLRQRDLLMQAHHLASRVLRRMGRGQEAAAHLSAAAENLQEMREGLGGEVLAGFLARPLTASFLRDFEAGPDAPTR